MTTTRVGGALVSVVVIAAAIGPLLLAADPVAQNLALRLAPPSWAHPFGLDELGRDILARVLSGARVSLFVAFAVVSVSSAVGVLAGALAGYLGGWTDTAVSRTMDVLMAFPGILLAIALVAMLGPSLRNVVLALVVIGWVGYARLIRAQVLRLRELEFVQAASACGATSATVLRRHILPSALPLLSVQASLGMATVILSEASLSFLGLGVQPPTPSWGAMLDAGRSHLLDAPHLTVAPGLALALLVVGFNFLGDGLRGSHTGSASARATGA
ncbi:MAG: ABC transporter permease [Vicinamibacterales bacterium]